MEVHKSGKKAIDYVRKNKKPYFLEFLTYRLVGHVGPDKNIDVGVRRKAKDLDFWNSNDPITIYKKYLIKNKIINSKSFDKIYKSISDDVSKVIEKVIRTGKKPDIKFLEKFHRYG